MIQRLPMFHNGPATTWQYHGGAKVCFPPFTPRTQHQHSRRQLRLRLRAGGHAGAPREGVVMMEPQDIFCGKTEEQAEVFCDTVSLRR